MGQEGCDRLAQRTSAQLAEFQALREEIKQRAFFQHMYLVLIFTVYGAVGTLYFGDPTNRLYVPCLLPVATLVLYCLWAHNAISIEGIGLYIESVLLPEISYSVGYQVLTWERGRTKSRLGVCRWWFGMAAGYAAHVIMSSLAPAVIVSMLGPVIIDGANRTMFFLWCVDVVAVLVTVVVYVVLVVLRDFGDRNARKRPRESVS